MDWSSESIVGFGYTVRPQAVCLDVRESIVNAAMRDSFGIVQLLGKPREKRKHCEVRRKELKAWRRKSVCFPLVSLGAVTAERDNVMRSG